jgi:hypothetical protein
MRQLPREGKMRRAATTFAMLALLAMIVVPVAAADKPTREFVPAPSEFTLDASICGFDVLVEVLTNKEYAITFSNGMTTVVGALSVRLTNLDDPTQSIVLNIPGPGFFDESGVTAIGPWLNWFFPGDLGPGSPGVLIYTVGRLRIDESGLHLLAGRQIDLCAELAGA